MRSSSPLTPEVHWLYTSLFVKLEGLEILLRYSCERQVRSTNSPRSNESENAVCYFSCPTLMTKSVLLVLYSLGRDFSCSLSLQQRTLSEISSGARCDRKARTLVTIQLLSLQVYSMKLFIIPCYLDATPSSLTLNGYRVI